MRLLTAILSLTFFISCIPIQDNNQQIVIHRIQYVYYLKSLIDIDIWKDFSDKKYDVPLIYYTDSNNFVINPTMKFINFYKPELVFESNEIKIYKTSLLDSIPFHMSASILFGDTTSDYNYKSPYMKCSSFEITKNIIPDVNSTEEWMTMLIHEYFHGFQYKHQVYLDFFEQEVVHIPADSLKRIYKSNQWFKDYVDKENDFLLTAIASNNAKEVSKCIDTFFQLRDERRLLTIQRLGFDIKTIEETYETMEGTARYVEYSLYGKFAVMEADDNLSKSDTSYHSYSKFRNYNIENDQWLFQTRKTTYFYATGYNMARLLDKIGIDYKSRLFKERELSLEQILKTAGNDAYKK